MESTQGLKDCRSDSDASGELVAAARVCFFLAVVVVAALVFLHLNHAFNFYSAKRLLVRQQQQPHHKREAQTVAASSQTRGADSSRGEVLFHDVIVATVRYASIPASTCDSK